MRYIGILLLVLALVVLFPSCGIEKRHYRNGYYLSGFHNREQTEPKTVSEQPLESLESITAVVAEDSSVQPIHVIAKENEVPINRMQDASGAVVQKTVETHPVVVEHPSPPAPPRIEPDKEQAIGAGIAAALFFFLGMGGLVATGGSGVGGIFIGAAFLCFILCIVLASFLYPKEAKVKTPKEEIPAADKAIMGVGFSLLLLCMLGVLGLAVWFLTAILSIF